MFMIGDFHYDILKTSSLKLMNIESESFTNRLSEFNMHKLIHKPTRVKPPSATLLDNIYTNIQITVDSCESGILTSNFSDHFIVSGFFDNMKINQTQNYTRKGEISENIECLSGVKASILSDVCKKQHCHCLCLQDTHRGARNARPIIPGMTLLAECPHDKNGSAIYLIRDDL